MKSQLRVFPGTVYSLGPDSANAAALYAGLTGRTYTKRNRLSELTVGANDVVVTACTNLTPQLMYRMFIHASGGCPGLICAPTEGELLEICRQQAQRLTGDQELQQCKRVFVYPQLSFASIEKGADQFVSGSEQTEALVESLSFNAAILAIFSAHSDGIGLALSLRHRACPFVNITEKGNELVPTCQLVGKCIELPGKPTIPEAREAGWLIPLSALRSSILLIAGCSIVRLQDGIVDARYGLAWTLFSQATFGAAIVTWRLERSRPDGMHMHSLLNDLARGNSVGAAVFAFNNSPLATHMGVNFGILGDPCFALDPHLDFPVLPIPPPDVSSSKGERLAIKASIFAEARLLEDVVLATSSQKRFDAVKVNKFANALSSYVASGVSKPDDQQLDELDSLLLDFGGATAPWVDRYVGLFSRVESCNEDGTCPICLAPARSIVVSFPRYQACDRHIIRCARCDDSSFRPSGWEMNLDLSQLEQRRILATVPEYAKVLLCLATHSGAIFTSAGNPGLRKAQYIFQLPDDLPPVPIRCQILIAKRLQIGCMSFGMRQLSNGQLSTVRSLSANGLDS